MRCVPFAYAAVILIYAEAENGGAFCGVSKFCFPGRLLGATQLLLGGQEERQLCHVSVFRMVS